MLQGKSFASHKPRWMAGAVMLAAALLLAVTLPAMTRSRGAADTGSMTSRLAPLVDMGPSLSDALEMVEVDVLRFSADLARAGVPITLASSFDLLDAVPANYSVEEQRCLGEAIYYEARNQSAAGQLAVADVVLNRVASRRYPSTICGVVYQGSHRQTGCQFSFTCDGSKARSVEVAAMERSKALADLTLRGFRPPITKSATHYHASYVSPYWAPAFAATAKIGDHIFYRRPKPVRYAMAD